MEHLGLREDAPYQKHSRGTKEKAARYRRQYQHPPAAVPSSAAAHVLPQLAVACVARPPSPRPMRPASFRRLRPARTRSGDSLLDPLLRPWARCNQCQRPYTGQTREALLRAMAEDRAKTWRKRLLSTLGTAAVTLAFCALYFAFVCSMDKIMVHLAENC